MNRGEPSKSRVQLVWGVALVAVGIAVFFRIPQVMPQLAQMGQSTATLGFIRICFYIMGILLVGGGTRKIITYLRSPGSQNQIDPGGGDGN